MTISPETQPMQVRILSPALQPVKAGSHAITSRYVSRLAVALANRKGSALAIAELPIVVAELKLAQVAVQVFLADAVIDTVQTAPHQPKEPLDSVRVHVAARVLVAAMPHRFMAASEVLADAAIPAPIIREDAGRGVNVLANHAEHRRSEERRVGKECRL